MLYSELRNLCLRAHAAWVKGVRVRNHRRLQYNGKGVADWVIWPSGGARRRDWALPAEWVGLVLRWELVGVDLGGHGECGVRGLRRLGFGRE